MKRELPKRDFEYYLNNFIKNALWSVYLFLYPVKNYKYYTPSWIPKRLHNWLYGMMWGGVWIKLRIPKVSINVKVTIE